MVPTPSILESIRTFSVWSRLSIMIIAFLTESNCSSSTFFLSLHASIVWMICGASSDNCCCSKTVFALVIATSPWPPSGFSGASCSFSCKESLWVASILLWYCWHYSGITIAAGDLGLSTLELLGASALLVYVNRLLRVAILNQTAILWWRDKSV